MPYLFCLSAQPNIINMTHKEQIIPFRLPFLLFLFILALSVITIVYSAKIDITSLHCKWFYTFFCFSVVCRSAKKFHLVFLSCAEAWKSFIWCFCRVQKHEKVSFGVSDACRSMKKQNEFIMLLIFYVFKGRWWFFKISTAHDGCYTISFLYLRLWNRYENKILFNHPFHCFCASHASAEFHASRHRTG